MQDRQSPKGIPAAINTIKALIGAKKMAALVNKTLRRIYFWGEANSEYSPPIRDCLILDAAFIRAGGKYAPILEAYRELLDVVADEKIRRPEDFRPALSDAAKECGEAIAAAISLGGDASEEARREAYVEVSQGISSLTELSRHLLDSLRSGRA